jgi:hypothetical protein
MCRRKWYLKRNISCDVHLLNELLESDVIMVSAGKPRKLWNSLSELCNYLYERRLEWTVLRPALLPVKTAQVTQFFSRQVWRHTLKSLSVTESVYGASELCWKSITGEGSSMGSSVFPYPFHPINATSSSPFTHRTYGKVKSEKPENRGALKESISCFSFHQVPFSQAIVVSNFNVSNLIVSSERHRG